MYSRIAQHITGYIFISGLLFSIGIKGQSRSAIHRLHNDLFSNYSSRVRPAFNQSEVTVIRTNMYLMTIHGLDEKAQELSFSGWIYMEWYDEFLQWDESSYNEISSILVPPTEVWRPDIAMSNRSLLKVVIPRPRSYICKNKTSYDGMTKYATGDYLIRVYSDGSMDWSPGDIFKTHCIVDITFYPFDTQTCNITMGTWMHDVTQVDIYPRGNISLADYKLNGEWDIMATNTYREENFGSCPGETTTITVTFSITMTRRKTFYILTVIIPVLLFSFLNVVDFVLPPESGERMSLSVTAFLSFAFFMSILNESMPRTSLSFSILGIYMIVVMAMGTMSVLMSAVVIMLHHRAREIMVQNSSKQTRIQRQMVQRKHQNRPDFLPGIENFETLSENIYTMYYDLEFPDNISTSGVTLDIHKLKDPVPFQAESKVKDMDSLLLAKRCDRFFLWFSLALTISGATVVLCLLTYN